MPEAYLTITGKYPEFSFAPGRAFSWNPNSRTVTFPQEDTSSSYFIYGLLHEIAHGILGHYGFKHDIELIKMERDAWSLATKLLKSHVQKIDQDHIEHCLDSYRDWLYARSQCPQCGLVGIQTDRHAYSCIHCNLKWKVPASRLCTVKRKILA